MLTFPLRRNRRALSLVELLLAVAVMGILAASLSALAMAVNMSSEYAQGHGEVAQHARVACERISRACGASTATADFPGFWVVTTTVGSYTFPDALVVWLPTTAAANPQGPPLLRELVVFTYDRANPARLLEMRVPSDSRSAPAITNSSAWQTEITAMHSATSAVKTQLTDLLRVGNANSTTVSSSDGTSGTTSSTTTNLRGVLRFDARYRPSTAEWTNYKAGTLTWPQLNWPQNMYGSSSGQRQSLCLVEMQLVPRNLPRQGSDAAAHAMPYFGSATRMSTLTK